MNEHFHGDIKLATCTGVIWAYMLNIQSGQIINTAIGAAIAATVSFIVSSTLRTISKRFRK